MTEQTNPNIFSVWLLGGRLVIISLSCYSMSGQGGGGVGLGWLVGGGGGTDEEGRGVGGLLLKT